ncbi:MAG: glycosyltransferase family 1 protein [Candidatus Acidoferrales bacterium]
MRIGLLLDNMELKPGGALHNYVSHLVREWSRQHQVWQIGSHRYDLGQRWAGTIKMSPWRRWRRQVAARTDVVHRPLHVRIPESFFSLPRPRVVTVHGATVITFARTGLFPRPQPTQLRFQERQGDVDLFLTVSESARREIVAECELPAERIDPIYLGVDPEVFFPPADKEAARRRARARLALPGPYLLHVSNYRPTKNGARIVAAYRRLWEQGRRDYSLVLAGEPKFGFEEVLRGIEQSPGRIVRLGRVVGRELTELYQGAEVYLSPSLHESFGLPALESMACGVPAVVSKLYAHPEVTGGAAVEVDPEKTEEIASAAARLLRDPAFYAERRQAGLARSRQFRWDVCARKHVEAFERAIRLFAEKSK